MLIPTAVVALGLIALGLATDTLITDFIANVVPEIPAS